MGGTDKRKLEFHEFIIRSYSQSARNEIAKGTATRNAAKNALVPLPGKEHPAGCGWREDRKGRVECSGGRMDDDLISFGSAAENGGGALFHFSIQDL